MFGRTDSIGSEYASNKAGLDLEHIGLLVYNLTTDLEEGLCPGLYVWSEEGTDYSWIRLPEPCPLPVKLENSPNSFFVKAGEAVEIPLGKPYIIAEQRADLPKVSLESKAYVELLWQDTQSLISNVELVGDNKGPYSVMKVTTNAAAGAGNALVAVRMGSSGTQSDPIVWSWHVWVTDYDPDNGGTSYPHNNGEKDYVFMDRNLGATTTTTTDINSMGLTYQWGRKDPFSGDNYFYGDGTFRTLYDKNNNPLEETNELAEGNPVGTGIQHVEIAESANLANSIANPMTFYYGPHSDNRINPADWYTNDATGASGNDNLWPSSGAKSPFDPCPKGWRVPSSSASRSPWFLFESVDDPWGWGPGSSPAQHVNTGMNFNNVSGATDLGFYPYGLYRIGSAYTTGCPMVGGEPFIVVGGLAYDCLVADQDRSAMYWMADPISGKAQVKAECFEYKGSMPMAAPAVSVMEVPRSTGAFVRCVKNEDADSPY